MTSSSPRRIADFRVLFSATVLSELGTNVSYVAIPLIAVSALDASAGQVGALASLSTLAFLLIGLPAGAWMDRMRQRSVLIAADFARAALFASVPVAWAFDVLSLGQLYVVVLLNGCATVFFDVGSQSILPKLVDRESLVRANAAVIGLQAVGNVAGRGAGGGLVQLLTAPVAIVCAAVSYLLSALRLMGIRSTPPPPSAARRRTRLRVEIAEGLRHVFGNVELRALVLAGVAINLGTQTINVLLPLVFVRELELPAGALGLFWAVGGLGIFLGSRCARPVAARLGHGRALAAFGVCLTPAGLLVPVIDHGVWLWVAGTAWLLVMVNTGTQNVLGVTLRQRLTPDSLLGRMNATFRVLLYGAHAVGAAVAGLVSEVTSLHTALWTGGCYLALGCVPILLSPIRKRRELPEQSYEPGAPQPASGTAAR
ncbi:MFS transporter [Streptomyces sp. NRRL S-920]|uniref:MFS transporter n=1 Tax=Streptomyces sp. NRRL S-920 TaxID=1463921 RepID=UPI0004C58D34|nr:MFS transporter [Streptomyces sp. NRRL S-920]